MEALLLEISGLVGLGAGDGDASLVCGSGTSIFFWLESISTSNCSPTNSGLSPRSPESDPDDPAVNGSTRRVSGEEFVFSEGGDSMNENTALRFSELFFPGSAMPVAAGVFVLSSIGMRVPLKVR